MQFPTDKLLKWSSSRTLRYTIALFATLAVLMFGTLSLFVAPAPSTRTAVEISGDLVSLSRPHPEHGDLSIVLDGGQSFYVNRANEVAYFDWERMLSDVHPGDQVYLTAITPLAWRLLGDTDGRHLPVAGVRTEHTVYLDPAIPAETWTAQAAFTGLAGISLFILALCVLPEFIRLFKSRPPAKTVAA